MSISPQGYSYKDAPLSTNPFWDKEAQEISTLTATASVDDKSLVKPVVKVTKTANEDGSANFDFAFSGINGKSIAFHQADATVSPLTGVNPYCRVTLDKLDLTDVNPETDTIFYRIKFDFVGIKGEPGAKGEPGTPGQPGEPGKPITEYVKEVGLDNQNGIYHLTVTDGTGVTKEIGTIEAPTVQIDKLIAEVTDSIVENVEKGYDYHTITETENGGTRNNVGSFYIARKQITELNSDGTFKTVDQSGTEGSGSIEIPTVPTIPEFYYGKMQNRSTKITFSGSVKQCCIMSHIDNVILTLNRNSSIFSATLIGGTTRYVSQDNTEILANGKVYFNITGTSEISGIYFHYVLDRVRLYKAGELSTSKWFKFLTIDTGYDARLYNYISFDSDKKNYSCLPLAYNSSQYTLMDVSSGELYKINNIQGLSNQPQFTADFALGNYQIICQ